jgi:hypothetical protein
MGIGIAFTFIGLVLLLVPVAWLVWWAADSMGNRPVHAAVAVPSVPRAVRTRFQYPEPVDLRLPSRPDLITVYRAVNAKPEYVCHGPDATGGCPIAHADGTVPCAGHTIVLPAAIRGSRDWQIPNGYTTCLAGSYGVFRQQPTA